MPTPDEYLRTLLGLLGGREPRPGEHPWDATARQAMESAGWGLARRGVGAGLALLDAPSHFVTRPLGGMAYQKGAELGGGLGVAAVDAALKAPFMGRGQGATPLWGNQEYLDEMARRVGDAPDDRSAWQAAYAGRDVDRDLAEGIYDPTNLAGVGVGKAVAGQAAKAGARAVAAGAPEVLGKAITGAGAGVARADKALDWTMSAPIALPLKTLRQGIKGIDYLNTLRRRMNLPDENIDVEDILSEADERRGVELDEADDWYFSGEDASPFEPPTSSIRAGSDENLRQSLADYDRRRATKAEEVRRTRERAASDTPPPPPPLEQARILEDRSYNAMAARQADERIKRQRMTNIAAEELERSLQEHARPETPMDRRPITLSPELQAAEMALGIEKTRARLAQPFDEGPTSPSIDQLGTQGGYLDLLKHHIGDEEFEVGVFSDHLQRHVTRDDLLLRDQLASLQRTDAAIKAGRLPAAPAAPEAQPPRAAATADPPNAAADPAAPPIRPRAYGPAVPPPPTAGMNAIDDYLQALRQTEARMGTSDQEYYSEAVPGVSDASALPRDQDEIDATDPEAAIRRIFAKREPLPPYRHPDLSDPVQARAAHERASAAQKVQEYNQRNPLVRPDARAHERAPEAFEEGRLDMPWDVAVEQEMIVHPDGLTMVPGETVDGYKERVAKKLEEEWGRSYDAPSGVGLNPPETTQAAIDFVTHRMFSGATWKSTINELKIMVGRPPDTVADFRDTPPAHLNQAEPVFNPNTGEYENPYKTAPGAATYIPTGQNKFREFMRKYADTPRAMYNPPKGLKTGDLPREPIDITSAYASPEDRLAIERERKATEEARWGRGTSEGHVSDPLLPGTVLSKDIGGHQRGSDSPEMQQYKADWHAHKLATMNQFLTDLKERRAALGDPTLGTEPQTVKGFKDETLEVRPSQEDEALAYIERYIKQRRDRLNQLDPYGGDVPKPETINEWHQWFEEIEQSAYLATHGGEAFHGQDLDEGPLNEALAARHRSDYDWKTDPIKTAYSRPVRARDLANPHIDDANLKAVREAADEANALPLDELEARLVRGAEEAGERGVGRWQRKQRAPGVEVPKGLNPQQRQRFNRQQWRRFDEEVRWPGKAYVHMPRDTEGEIAFIRQQFERARAREEGAGRSKKMRKPPTPISERLKPADLGAEPTPTRPDDLPLERPTPIKPGVQVPRGGKFEPAFRGEKFFLSNLSPARVTIDGVQYPSSEAAYYAARTDDPALKEKLRNATSGAHARSIGQRATLDRNDDKRMLAMIRVIRAKFKQNPDLREKLLATGEETLEESNNWGDDFWGVDQRKGGQNMLGHILMEIRDEIRRGDG